MERKNLSDLVSEMQNINPDSREGIAQFVRTFFDTLTSGLKSDGYVKVKGFGTFRIVDISPRESVDVSSGRRIEIKGHAKITFVPDASLRDAVNEPFSHLQSVAINEETDLQQMSLADDDAVAALLGDDATLAAAAEQEEKTTPTDDAAEHSDDVPETISMPAQAEDANREAAQDNGEESGDDAVAGEDADESSDADESGEELSSGASEPSDSSETDVASAESPAVDEVEYASDYDAQSQKNRRGLFAAIIICVVVAALAFAAGYYAGMNGLFTVKAPAVVEHSRKAAIDVLPSQKKVVKDSAKADAASTMPDNQKAQKPKPETEKKAGPKPELKKPVMPVQRGDAYAIVGQRGTHALVRGENISKLAKKIYGSKDCAKYIIRYNGISNPDHIEIGQTLKLPELEPLNR